MSNYPAAPHYLLEQSICNYLMSASIASGSVLSGSIYTCYTGMGNVDVISPPAVIVDASDNRETIPFSRVMEFNVKIHVKEMAEETTNIGVLAGGIFNEFMDSKNASNNFSNTGSYFINIWQVQVMGMYPNTSGDTLVNSFEAKMIGALI